MRKIGEQPGRFIVRMRGDEKNARGHARFLYRLDGLLQRSTKSRARPRPRPRAAPRQASIGNRIHRLDRYSPSVDYPNEVRNLHFFSPGNANLPMAPCSPLQATSHSSLATVFPLKRPLPQIPRPRQVQDYTSRRRRKRSQHGFPSGRNKNRQPAANGDHHRHRIHPHPKRPALPSCRPKRIRPPAPVQQQSTQTPAPRIAPGTASPGSRESPAPG